MEDETRNNYSQETEQERINRMYRQKQNRIARQTALQSAVDTVIVNPASQIKEPSILANKILEVAGIYLGWIEVGAEGRG